MSGDRYIYGGFLKGWYSQINQNWTILVLKPMVLRIYHFKNPSIWLGYARVIAFDFLVAEQDTSCMILETWARQKLGRVTTARIIVPSVDGWKAPTYCNSHFWGGPSLKRKLSDFLFQDFVMFGVMFGTTILQIHQVLKHLRWLCGWRWSDVAPQRCRNRTTSRRNLQLCGSIVPGVKRWRYDISICLTNLVGGFNPSENSGMVMSWLQSTHHHTSYSANPASRPFQDHREIPDVCGSR